MVLDIKGELYEATAGYRNTLGKVYVIDPEAVGDQFDPLYGRFTERQLYASAKYLLYEEGERDPIFIQRGMKMLTQLFLAAREENRLCRKFSCGDDVKRVALVGGGIRQLGYRIVWLP